MKNSIPLTGLTRSHVCACPWPRPPGFPMPYAVVFFSSIERVSDGCSFLDIEGYDDHYCLTFFS